MLSCFVSVLTEVLWLGIIMSSNGNTISRYEARHVISKYEKVLKKLGKYQICGSYRRGKEEMGDLDFVIADCAIADLVTQVENVFPSKKIRSGRTLLSLAVTLGEKIIQVEFITIPLKSFGSAMLHATGNAKFNVGMRVYATNKGFDKLNQYGLYKDGAIVASETETEVLNKLGLNFIPPEKRNDWWSVYKTYKLDG
jgi:DNA polymerase (family X)